MNRLEEYFENFTKNYLFVFSDHSKALLWNYICSEGSGIHKNLLHFSSIRSLAKVVKNVEDLKDEIKILTESFEQLNVGSIAFGEGFFCKQLRVEHMLREINMFFALFPENPLNNNENNILLFSKVLVSVLVDLFAQFTRCAYEELTRPVTIDFSVPKPLEIPETANFTPFNLKNYLELLKPCLNIETKTDTTNTKKNSFSMSSDGIKGETKESCSNRNFLSFETINYGTPEQIAEMFNQKYNRKIKVKPKLSTEERNNAFRRAAEPKEESEVSVKEIVFNKFGFSSEKDHFESDWVIENLFCSEENRG